MAPSILHAGAIGWLSTEGYGALTKVYVNRRSATGRRSKVNFPLPSTSRGPVAIQGLITERVAYHYDGGLHTLPLDPDW